MTSPGLRAAATLPDGGGSQLTRATRSTDSYLLALLGRHADLWRASDEFVAGSCMQRTRCSPGSRVDGAATVWSGAARHGIRGRWPWDPHRAGRPGGGEPPGAREGGGATVSLLFAIARRLAGGSARGAGNPGPRAGAPGAPASPRVRETCWNGEQGLFEDWEAVQPDTNILACSQTPSPGTSARGRRVTADDGLVRASLLPVLPIRSARPILGARVVDEAVPWKRLPGLYDLP